MVVENMWKRNYQNLGHLLVGGIVYPKRINDLSILA
jgi:hypothetical protein